MKIVLRIDRLVLHGIDAGPDAVRRIRLAFERELARLTAGAPRAAFESEAVPARAAPTIRAAGEPPETIGSRIAAAVHAAILGGEG